MKCQIRGEDLTKCTLCPHKSVYRSLKAFILDQVNKQRIKIRILLFSSQMNFKLNVTEAFCIKVLAQLAQQTYRQKM